MAVEVGFENCSRKDYMVTTYTLLCDYCSNIFTRTSKDQASRKKRNALGNFCSRDCHKNYGQSKIYCKECNSLIITKKSVIRKFCSKSCSTIYNNRHKSTGIRRSKLEKWLEIQLNAIYPSLNILYNSKTIIGSELDIYIPSMKLAFELNGIFHYEPIYGQDKLNQIQSNDSNKFQTCQKIGISLCIIDVSSQKYFKENTSRKFLDIICLTIGQALPASK